MREFKTTYWGADQSTAVRFEVVATSPPQELISAAFVFALNQNQEVIIAKSQRGWGLPGGHREGDETAEACVRREALEEAAVALRSLKLIGQWVAKKKFDSPLNQKYPPLAYQLLYIADIDAMLPFTPDFETTERTLIPLAQLADYHNNHQDLDDIFEYVIDEHCRI
ncbi:MAG TPA: NUDIX domain-containing protein [Verrucomicrobiae bacterium]|nr:NUDIX domain-containing protein [Verrucomicrobiae bacterium]